MKHKVKIIIILAVEFIAIVAMLLCIFFAGKKSYTVTFDLNGGTLISGDLEQKVTQGKSANPPKATKDGCYFLQWSGSYREVTKDVTIRAVWEYETTEGIEYEIKENANYCEIVGCYSDLKGDVYIGAYYDGKKVLGIKEGAFKNCENITSVYLLDGILAIEDEAFAGCTNLEKIEMPSTLIRLGNSVFEDCESLEQITLPASLEKMGNKVFAGCKDLKELLLPESVIVMGSGVFDQAEMVVKTYQTAENVPQAWATDWYSNGVVVEWGYVDEEETEKDENE